MKRKGFTLIELLAVIVILAIIALIATPAVLNIIEDSRKGAAEASARNIINAAKTYYMSETMQGRTVGNIDLSTNTLKYEGEQASKGSITFTDGKANGKLYINGYCVEVDVNGKVTSEKMEEEDCEVIITENSSLGCDTLYWDGNIEGHTIVTLYNDDGTVLENNGFPLILVKISDVVLFPSDVPNGFTETKVIVGPNGIEMEEPSEYIKEDISILQSMFDDIGSMNTDNGTYFIPTNNYDLGNNAHFDEAGIYCLYITNGTQKYYLQSLTIPGFTGFTHSNYCEH